MLKSIHVHMYLTYLTEDSWKVEWEDWWILSSRFPHNHQKTSKLSHVLASSQTLNFPHPQSSACIRTTLYSWEWEREKERVLILITYDRVVIVQLCFAYLTRTGSSSSLCSAATIEHSLSMLQEWNTCNTLLHCTRMLLTRYYNVRGAM